jgi:hypothetical protein
MMPDKIQTLHPDKGKQGVNIDRAKYDQAKAAIVATLTPGKELTFKALFEQASARLGKSFDGSPGWYVTTVKLDLEARGILERVGKSPQMVRLKK